MTIPTVTGEPLAQMAGTEDPRLKEIADAPVRHLHARKLNLTPEETLGVPQSLVVDAKKNDPASPTPGSRAVNGYGHDDFVDTGCGMGRAATLWLLQRGVRVVGTDAWSWDAPFSFTRDKVKATGDASLIWEGHRAGRRSAISRWRSWGTCRNCRPTGSR